MRKKVAESYGSPNLILTIKESFLDNLLVSSNHHMKVLLGANRYLYENPPHAKESKLPLFSDNDNNYFKFTTSSYNNANSIKGRLYTLSECSRHKDCFVVIIPENFSWNEVSMSNKTIKQFIDDFEEKYRKF